MLPYSLQGLATRWLASLPGRDSHPLDYATLPGRTQLRRPLWFLLKRKGKGHLDGDGKLIYEYDMNGKQYVMTLYKRKQ
jgi:hypothetical protein